MTGQLAPDRPGLISVRRAAPADRAALADMFERCTPRTRYRRFHGLVKAIPERYLADALSGSPLHHALVACPVSAASGQEGADLVASPGPGPAAPVGEIVGLASCRVIGQGAAELGVLIEDAWQRHGLGACLLTDLVTHAGRSGQRILEAQLLAEQAWIMDLLRAHGPCHLRFARDGVLNVTVRLGQDASILGAAPSITSPEAPGSTVPCGERGAEGARITATGA